MEIKNLTTDELNALHYDLSYNCTKALNLNEFYQIQNQMLLLRREYRRRVYAKE